MSSTARPDRSATFDEGAAVMRSMLGWGVVAGPFYLALGLVLALTRDADPQQSGRGFTRSASRSALG